MTTTTETPRVPNPHRIDIELAAGGDVRPTVSCTAPMGAPCRLHCGICEDYWNDDHNAHEMVDQGYCLATEGWFDDPMFILEMYDGDPQPIHSGPIVLTFDGDGMTWSYDVPEKTYWNGMETEAVRGTAIVGAEAAFPLHWARDLVGQRIAVVRVNLDGVNYGGGETYLDDREGQGWAKVTGGGGPQVGHASLDIVPGSFEAVR